MRFSTAVPVVTLALVAASLTSTTEARATALPSASASARTAAAEFTPQQLDEAVDEARALGRVREERRTEAGDLTSTIDLGQGVTIEVVRPQLQSTRIGAGSDSYGKYISLNSFDQNVIYTGAGFGLTAGMCAISAGTFCLVAGAIIAAAGLAVSTNGGQCASHKTLRVYPFSGHKPRCV